MSFKLQAPTPYFEQEALGGTIYRADRMGIISNIATGDLYYLIQFGCREPAFLARIVGADMNSTDPQPFEMMTDSPYRINLITVVNATTSLTTAVGGIYAAAAEGGTPIVPDSQLYSDLTATNIGIDLTLGAGQGAIIHPGGSIPLLLLTVPQGSDDARCDFIIYGDLFGVSF
jgi:hypothetical protein